MRQLGNLDCDWVFDDIKKLLLMFRCDNSIVVMFLKLFSFRDIY